MRKVRALARSREEHLDVQRLAVKSRLLKALSTEAFALLAPHLQPMAAQNHRTLTAASVPIDRLFFPEPGFASVTTVGNAGRAEVGMIGREGVVGAALDRGPPAASRHQGR